MEEKQNIRDLQSTVYQDDEITLKELIGNIQEFINEIRKYWKLIGIGILIGVVIFLGKRSLTPVTFEADLTFMLNDDEGGGGGGASAILGQFGLGGTSSGAININKMIELSKSRKIVSMVLFEKIEMDGKIDYIANHIIRLYDLHRKWEDNLLLKGFLFQNDDIDSFGRKENSALKKVYNIFVNQPLMTVSSNDETNILKLQMVTLNEQLSLRSTEIFFQNLEKYYVAKATNKQKASYHMLKQRVDSLEAVLNQKQLAALKFEDYNRNLGLKQYKIEQLKIQGEIQKIVTNYGESYRQLTIAEYTLQNKTPFITTIDEPIYPLNKEQSSIINAIAVGSILGSMIMIVFIVGRKFLRDMLV